MIELCGRKVYPVIVSPMGSVTDENNYKVWLDNNFICVVPRTVDYNKRLEISKETFASFSLSEAKSLMIDIDDGEKHYICIDIAHGTMAKLYRTCKELKKKFGGLIVIMTGNVANPDAYIFYVNNGIDYMRACIGTGSRCLCPGTQITMADGTQQAIEDIDVGDMVKTVNGNRRVINTFAKETKETVIINGNVESTPEHKFLVVKKSDAELCKCDDDIKEKAFFLEAEFISDEYMLVME